MTSEAGVAYGEVDTLSSGAYGDPTPRRKARSRTPSVPATPAPFDQLAGSRLAPPSLGPGISICIPAYNEERNIGRLLTSILEEKVSRGTILEVLVDASGSTDTTCRIVREIGTHYPLVRLIDTGKRDGLVNSLSRMFQQAIGQIIVRMDADVAPAPGVLDRLIAPLEAPRAGISSPQIIPSNGLKSQTSRLTRAEYVTHHYVSLRCPKTTVIQAFKNVAFSFPPGAECEDNLIQDELARRGLQAVYVPEAAVFIMTPATISDYIAQRIRCLASGRWYARYSEREPITQSAHAVFPAVLDVVRDRAVPLSDLALFMGLEVILRVGVSARKRVFGHKSRTTWTPLATTKTPSWRDAARPPPPPARAPR